MIKLKVGDRIKIINYGHIITKDDGIEHIVEDVAPYLIGLETTIIKIENIGGYAVSIEGKIKWLKRDQIQLLPSLQEEQFLNHLDELCKDSINSKLEFIQNLKIKFQEIWSRNS